MGYFSGLSYGTSMSNSNIPFTLNSVGGTAGAGHFYRKVEQQQDEDVIQFARKMFSFFAI